MNNKQLLQELREEELDEQERLEDEQFALEAERAKEEARY